MKRVSFHTLGCKVNQVETEQLIEDFIERGYQIVEFGDPADVCVVNTCTVTHISDRKSRAILRRAIRNNPGMLVVATGCLAQVNTEQLSAIEGLGLIVGNQCKDQIGGIVDGYLNGFAQRIWLTPSDPNVGLIPTLYSCHHQRTRAFVKIQDGCQSFCSYCIVPLARGPVRSKKPADVVAEINNLVELGYKEIVLTGIHTGQYGLDIPGWDITRLLAKILQEVTGQYRIRLSSIEPLELNDQLLELAAGEARICRHFHIPLQSGSNRILLSMGRRYSREYYRELVLKAAQLVPGAAFTADVMVGYPSEDDQDFFDTYRLIEELPIYELHVFQYSPRAGTRAAEIDPQVEAADKHKRSQDLLVLGQVKRQQFIQASVGCELETLVERRLQDDTYLGLSDNYINIHFNSPEDITRQLVRLKIDTATAEYAIGSRI